MFDRAPGPIRLLLPALLTFLLAASGAAGQDGETPEGIRRGTAPQATAPVEFEPRVLDLGLLRPHRAAAASFKLHNTGSEPLRIKSLRSTSSRVTPVNLGGAIIEPGAAVEIRVTVAGREARAKRSARVLLEIDGYPSYQWIRVRAEYAWAVRTIPPFISAMTANSGRIGIESVDGRPFRVLAVNGGPPDFIDFDPQSDEQASSYKLAWDISEYDRQTCTNAAGERIPRHLAVETDHPGAPIVDAMIRHHCNVFDPKGRSWHPRLWNLIAGVIEPGQSATATFGVRWLAGSDHGDAIHMALAESTEATVHLVETNGPPGQREYTLSVTPASKVRGLFVVPVRLFSRDHEARISIMGVVRDSDPGP